MAKEADSSGILLTATGSNFRAWRASLYSKSGALCRDILTQGGIQFLMSAQQFQDTFNTPPTPF